MNKKIKIYNAIYYIILLMVVILIFKELFFTDEPNIKTVSKGIVVLVVYVLTATGVIRGNHATYKFYENQYKDIIGSAFENSRKNKNELLRAIELFNRNRYEMALKKLEKVEKECVTSDDMRAMLMFRALIYSDCGRGIDAINTYEECIKYGATGKLYSNLGYQYAEMNDNIKAEEYYKKSIATDPENVYAYNNIAALYVRCERTDEAIEYALKCLELSPGLSSVMSTLSVAYKLKGDNENSVKYCNMYAVNGGDVKALKLVLDNITV